MYHLVDTHDIVGGYGLLCANQTGRGTFEDE